MRITIGKFDRATGTVPVTFDYEGVQHRRCVNACLSDKGRYDADATKLRVDDVAEGVAHKIRLGVITNLVSEPAAPEAATTE